MQEAGSLPPSTVGAAVRCNVFARRGDGRMTLPLAPPTTVPRPLDRLAARFLRPFAEVEPDEAIASLLLMLCVFLLLTAYYFLKTAREPLILLHGGAEVKSYASAGQSLLLLLVIPGYAALARRVGRLPLVISVYAFFTFNLLAFAGLAARQVEIGVAFYLWVGVFNNTAIAQFWGFANDIYTPEQGQRLFAVLGIGSSVGAVAGALLAKRLAALGPAAMMLAAAGLLVVCLCLFVLVERRERREPRQLAAVSGEPPLQGSAWALLAGDTYLLLIAALTFLLNCVNSTGEYVLDRTLLNALAGAGGAIDAVAEVGRFKADYFFWVNVAGVSLQLFAVSRIMRVLGVRRALYVLPLIACVGYGVMLLAPVLALIRLAKIAENSVDYSLQNTVRQALFLVGNRSEKYVGKTVIDTFVVRVGDVFSATLVYIGGRLALTTQAFAILNLILIVCWLFVLGVLGREHVRREAAFAAEAKA
jgi:AAA family ATP:ADP antiporter